jgi:hypothetical protein
MSKQLIELSNTKYSDSGRLKHNINHEENGIPMIMPVGFQLNHTLDHPLMNIWKENLNFKCLTWNLFYAQPL